MMKMKHVLSRGLENNAFKRKASMTYLKLLQRTSTPSICILKAKQ